MALLLTRVDPQSQKITVDTCDTVDLRTMCQPDQHTSILFPQCSIPHSNEACDRVAHFWQKYRQELDTVDIILLEQQPPSGSTFSIQQLIMTHCRSRVKLVSPRHMHKILHFHPTCAETRKSQSVQLATPYLQHFQQFTDASRQHDMADAMCMLLLWCQEHKPLPPSSNPLPPIEKVASLPSELDCTDCRLSEALRITVPDSKTPVLSSHTNCRQESASYEQQHSYKRQRIIQRLTQLGKRFNPPNFRNSRVLRIVYGIINPCTN